MFFYHMMSNAAAKVSGLIKGAPEVIAAIIHNLLFKSHTTTLTFNIFVALPRRQYQNCTEILFFYYMMSNAAAKVSGLT